MSAIFIIEQTFYAICRTWGGLNSSVKTVGSIRSMTTGIDSPDLNMVWAEKPLEPSDDEAIEKVVRSFQARRLPFWFWVFPSAKTAATLDILKAEGLTLASSIPCLLADLQLTPEKVAGTAVTTRRVFDKTDLGLWRDVSFAGFDFPPETRQQYEQFSGSFDLRPECPHQLFLSFYEGRPAATSILLLTDNAAGIYFVTTLAQYRKKGIGLALMQATLHQAKAAGARWATLQSSPDGLHVYERAGFKEYCRVDVYGRKAPHHKKATARLPRI